MSSVKELCGIKLTDESFKKINTDGSYIFDNDASYQKVKLTDRFNRTITVNSFEECEHYVLGGWNRSESMNVEHFSQYFLLILIVIVILKRKYFSI